MARKKRVKPTSFQLKVQPFNKDKPDKWPMRIAVPVYKKVRKPRKSANPERLTFSAGTDHTFWSKALPSY